MADPTFNRPLVRCGCPDLRADPCLAEPFVSGWAFAPEGLSEVRVDIGERSWLAWIGMRRDDVALQMGLDGEVPRQFALHLADGELAAGTHEIRVQVISRNGRRDEQRGRFRLDPDEPYRRWLTRLPQPPGARACPERIALSVLGPTSEDRFVRSLERQTSGQVATNREARAALADLAGRPQGCLVIADGNGELVPEAIALLSEAVLERGAGLAYADEHRLDHAGRPVGFDLKPGFSPELLLAGNYIGGLVALGPAGARAAVDVWTGNSIYELLLAVSSAAVHCERIPRPLLIDGSRRNPRDERRSLEAMARWLGREIRILPGARASWLDAGWQVRGTPLVSVVIPSRGGVMLERCLHSLRRTGWPLEVIVVHQGRAPAISEVPGLDPKTVSWSDGQTPFNFSRAVNAGVEAARGDYILLLNDDVQAPEDDWLGPMLGHAQTPGVGAVGAKLCYPDGRIQHGGVLTVDGAGARHLFLGWRGDSAGHANFLKLTRNVSAVTGACMLVPRDTWESLGGFDERFPLDYGDTDFCLRAREQGLRSVFAPSAQLIHHESATRRPEQTRALSADAGTLFSGRWQATLPHDPYYHPAFDPEFDYVVGIANRWSPEPTSSMSTPMTQPASVTTEAQQAQDAAAYEPPPTSSRAMREALEAGKPVMWCEAPALDGSARAHRELFLRGWAYSRSRIDHVTVTLDGGEPTILHPQMSRVDVAAALLDLDADRCGFQAHIDVRGFDPGPHLLRVVASSGEHRVGMEGQIVVLEEGAEEPDAGSEPALSGERLVPEAAENSLVRAEHEARYRMASTLAAGRRALDAGCGVGYGSAILAAAGARSVIGIDRSPEAIVGARGRAGGVAQFQLADLEDLPFADQSFDLICCFEVIEHVLRPERAFDELRRVLDPTGVLVVSSPNPDAYTPGNPWHVRELRPEELREMLAERFGHVALYGQMSHLATLVAPAEDLASSDPARTIPAEVRKVAGSGRVVYSLALAGDQPLPHLEPSVVLSDVYEHREVVQLLHEFEERAILAEVDAQASRAEMTIATTAVERAEKHADEAEQAWRDAAARFQEIASSRSWQMTAPLRRMTARLQRVRRRLG